MMLGKDRMAELRSIAKLHNLAVGSQTVPNSVAEIAAAQGQSPPVGPSNAVALPAALRKKLPPKRAKRKAPRVVSDEEADESTEDRLICKRRRGVATEPLATEVAPPDYTENPLVPPRPSSPPGTFSPPTPQLLKLRLNSLLIHKLPPKLQQNCQPHHHASRLPSPSNLARVVVSISPYLLLQHRAFQLPSKKP